MSSLRRRPAFAWSSSERRSRRNPLQVTKLTSASTRSADASSAASSCPRSGLPGRMRSVDVASGVSGRGGAFGAADLVVAEGDGAETQLWVWAVQEVGVGGDGAHAAAAHGVEEGAFGGDAMECVGVVQLCNDGIDLLVVAPAFVTEGGLADAGKHLFDEKNCGEQS